MEKEPKKIVSKKYKKANIKLDKDIDLEVDAIKQELDDELRIVKGASKAKRQRKVLDVQVIKADQQADDKAITEELDHPEAAQRIEQEVKKVTRKKQKKVKFVNESDQPGIMQEDVPEISIVSKPTEIENKATSE